MRAGPAANRTQPRLEARGASGEVVSINGHRAAYRTVSQLQITKGRRARTNAPTTEGRISTGHAPSAVSVFGVLAMEGRKQLSTSTSGFCMFVAGNLLRYASQPMLTGLWWHFEGGSNFRNSALLGSGYAGLGQRAFGPF